MQEMLEYKYLQIIYSVFFHCAIWRAEQKQNNTENNIRL